MHGLKLALRRLQYYAKRNPVDTHIYYEVDDDGSVTWVFHGEQLNGTASSELDAKLLIIARAIVIVQARIDELQALVNTKQDMLRRSVEVLNATLKVAA